jgi:preprotein translocase subunit SecF
MIIVKQRNIFFALTGLLVALCVGATLTFGLHLGTDFTGGTLAEFSYEGGRPDAQEITKALSNAGVHGVSLREANENDYILRSAQLNQTQRDELQQTLSLVGHPATITQYTEVGPTIGTELRTKALLSTTLVLICILLFIAFAFRKVSKPISSWVYGIIALVTLLHDVVVPVGFFSVLGHLYGAEVDTLFVTAVLTVLGFSVHDTIVVFDRVRENLRINQEKGRKEDFEETAARSLNQTVVRSINTSMTVVFTLLVLFLVGPESTRYFALTLLVGIIGGTYSSVALATPLLVVAERWMAKKKK